MVDREGLAAELARHLFASDNGSSFDALPAHQQAMWLTRAGRAIDFCALRQSPDRGATERMREACAKLCEERASSIRSSVSEDWTDERKQGPIGRAFEAEICATKIRALPLAQEEKP